jgi:hypothetical protein
MVIRERNMAGCKSHLTTMEKKWRRKTNVQRMSEHKNGESRVLNALETLRAKKATLRPVPSGHRR